MQARSRVAGACSCRRRRRWPPRRPLACRPLSPLLRADPVLILSQQRLSLRACSRRKQIVCSKMRPRVRIAERCQTGPAKCCSSVVGRCKRLQARQHAAAGQPSTQSGRRRRAAAGRPAVCMHAAAACCHPAPTSIVHQASFWERCCRRGRERRAQGRSSLHGGRLHRGIAEK